jgi:leader peptidase (prepilin peptidase)/N-methyltransferase
MPASVTLFFVFVLVGVAVLDAEHLWIADAITLPGILLALTVPILFASLSGEQLSFRSSVWTQLGGRLFAALASALLILVIRWTYKLIRHREGIGIGDAKLMAMLGAWLGLSGALLSFAIGIMLGALFALILIAVPTAWRESETWSAAKLPLGTFLCIGGIISALWGQFLIDAYLHWAGL